MALVPESSTGCMQWKVEEHFQKQILSEHPVVEEI